MKRLVALVALLLLLGCGKLWAGCVPDNASGAALIVYINACIAQSNNVVAGITMANCASIGSPQVNQWCFIGMGPGISVWNGSTWANGATFHEVVNPSANGTITVNAGENAFYQLTLTGNVTIELCPAAVNPNTETSVAFGLRQDGAGGHTVTYDTCGGVTQISFQATGGISPVMDTVAGMYNENYFTYHSSVNQWVEDAMPLINNAISYASIGVCANGLYAFSIGSTGPVCDAPLRNIGIQTFNEVSGTATTFTPNLAAGQGLLLQMNFADAAATTLANPLNTPVLGSVMWLELGNNPTTPATTFPTLGSNWFKDNTAVMPAAGKHKLCTVIIESVTALRIFACGGDI